MILPNQDVPYAIYAIQLKIQSLNPVERQAPQRVVGPSIEVELAAFLDTQLRPQWFQGILVTSLDAWNMSVHMEHSNNPII